MYRKSLDNNKIVIIGKKNHPEVVGTLGWCLSGSAIVIENESDLNDVDLVGKICVVGQTTCSRKLWENVTCRMLEINDSIELCDTLCDVMRNREEKAKEIAKDADTMIVVGDSSSSNSRELYKECCTVCENTFFISSYIDIENNAEIKNAILHSTNIGVAGSASAPSDIIEDVYHYLSFIDYQKNAFVQDSLDSLEQQNEGGKENF